MSQRLHAVDLVLLILVALFLVVLGAAVWLVAGAGDAPAVAAAQTGATGGRPPWAAPPAAPTLAQQGILPTIPPWPTMQNTPTSEPPTPPIIKSPNPLISSLQSPIASPTLAPSPREPLNGIPWENIIVLSPEAAAHTREIFAAGQALGRNAHAFSKVGDSTTENPHFLARFDEGTYNLGPYAYLQPAIDHFRGSHGRDSVAVAIGLHAWTANDPMWADGALCLPNETPVECEIRVHNPAYLIIRLGTNDVGVAASFDANIRRMVDTTIAAGIIPIIGTKGDRHEGSNENNDILRRIAADYRIPLWDYDRVADTLPGRGLDVDAAHMITFYSHDYTDPTAFTRGHAMHNLTALMMLDAVWRVVMQN